MKGGRQVFDIARTDEAGEIPFLAEHSVNFRQGIGLRGGLDSLRVGLRRGEELKFDFDAGFLTVSTGKFLERVFPVRHPMPHDERPGVLLLGGAAGKKQREKKDDELDLKNETLPKQDLFWDDLPLLLILLLS